jgi:hypothetical protein
LTCLAIKRPYQFNYHDLQYFAEVQTGHQQIVCILRIRCTTFFALIVSSSKAYNNKYEKFTFRAAYALPYPSGRTGNGDREISENTEHAAGAGIHKGTSRAEARFTKSFSR